MSLSFDTLREANNLRLPEFTNALGEFAHKNPDGSDWSRSDWLEAIVGELGEYANKSKKNRRGDISDEEFLIEAKKELADVVTYIDILAKQLSIDLGEAIANKFNEVSRRINSSVFFSLQHDKMLGHFYTVEVRK
jgi:NTP pyrophosphatase (non-canonical NTP hydrolase)